jgi:threonine aldolase
MANQIALKIHTRPGCLLIAQERTHIMVFEAGGPAVHSGLVMVGLPSASGRISPEQIRAVVLQSEDVEPASIVVLEQTHRSAGGRVWPLDELAASAAAARELGLAVHLDGARIMNASAESGIPAAEYGGLADSVTICFSKGLGCPLGAVLASSEERIDRAWRQKFLFGGAMRQAGVVAAAALYALDHNVARLAEDHARARRLAEGLAEAGIPVELDAVETNFVGIPVPEGMDVPEARARIREEGVLVSVLRPGVLRAATYLGIEDEDIDRALDAIPRALGALVGA